MYLEKLRKTNVMPSCTKYIYEPTEAVSDTNYSIEAQEDAIREYAQKHGLMIESTIDHVAMNDLGVM